MDQHQCVGCVGVLECWSVWRVGVKKKFFVLHASRVWTILIVTPSRCQLPLRTALCFYSFRARWNDPTGRDRDRDDTIELKHFQRLAARKRGPSTNTEEKLIHQEFEAYGEMLKYMVAEISKLVYMVGDRVEGRRSKGTTESGKLQLANEVTGATIRKVDGYQTSTVWNLY